MSLELGLQLEEHGSDAERVDELTRTLRQRLLDTDVGEVQRSRGSESQPGSKGVLIDVGKLVVDMANAGVVSAVVAVVGSFVRGKRIKVTVTLDGDSLTIDGASPGDPLVAEPVKAWLARHPTG